MSGKFKLYRIGSDPEFVFAKQEDYTPVLVPAQDIIAVPKNKSLESFIGMDSHTLGGQGVQQTTAELRPPPAYNVWLHLYYIAYGIDKLGSYLAEKPKWKGVKAVAVPIFEKEALGGHIHVSGFVPEPETKAMLHKFNMVRVGDTLKKWNHKLPGVGPGEASNILYAKTAAEYTRKALACEVTTPELFLRAMNYLILPFEMWIQPWHERAKRMEMFDGHEDGFYFIRWLHSTAPNMPRFKDWCYLHMEYRTPSTWLAHPWLAYAYFALAKLTILNWHLIWPRMLEGRQIVLPMSNGNAHNDECKEEFFNRLKDLRAAGLTMSKDLWDLDMALKTCAESRGKWWSTKLAGIDIDAWRSLL